MLDYFSEGNQPYYHTLERTEHGDADYTFLTVNAIDGTVIDRAVGY